MWRLPGRLSGEDQYSAHADRSAAIAASASPQRLGDFGVSVVERGAAAAVAILFGAADRALEIAAFRPGRLAGEFARPRLELDEGPRFPRPRRPVVSPALEQ